MVAEVSQETLQQVVEEDRRLEETATRSARDLMQHRWHWTLDESNPKRVSLHAYAEAVGRSFGTIKAYAQGFVVLTNERPGGMSPDEARRRADMTAEREAATEAVAAAQGVKFRTALDSYAPEVRRVRDIAHVRAEEHGTSVVDEVAAAAQEMKEEKRREEQHRKEEQERIRRREEERKQRHTFRYTEAESQLAKAREHLLQASRAIDGVQFSHEERDLLSVSLNTVRRLVDTMDEAIVGKRSPDWGEKVRVLGGE